MPGREHKESVRNTDVVLGLVGFGEFPWCSEPEMCLKVSGVCSCLTKDSGINIFEKQLNQYSNSVWVPHMCVSSWL